MRRPGYLILFAGLVIVAVMSATLSGVLGGRPPNLGVVDGRLTPCSSRPNCVSSQAQDGSHQIEAIAFSGDPRVTLNTLAVAVERMAGARIVRHDDGYLHAEFTSALLRFVDDLELWVDAEGQVVHVRSASRVGYSDRGVNRQRVEALREAFEAVAEE